MVPEKPKLVVLLSARWLRDSQKILLTTMENEKIAPGDHVSQTMDKREEVEGGVGEQSVVGDSRVTVTVQPYDEEKFNKFLMGIDAPTILERPVALTSIAIATAAPVAGSVLVRDAIKEWAESPDVVALLDQYDGFRGDMELTCVMVGAALTAGLYAVGLQDDGDVVDQFNRLYSVVEANATSNVTWDDRNFPQTNCVMLNPAESKVVTFKMPYHAAFPFYRTGGGRTYPWKFGFCTYMEAVSGANALPVSTSMRLFIRLLPKGAMGGYIFQSAVSNGLRSAADLAAALGYTREQIVGTQEVMVPRGVHFTAHVDDKEEVERIGLYRSGRLTADATKASADCMLLSTLCAQPSMVRRFEWPVTSAPLTELCRLPVTPFLSEAPVGAAEAGTYVPPVAGYVGYPFESWRADMVYRIYVPAAETDRFALNAYWTPREGSLLNSRSVTRLAAHILEGGGPTCVEVRVPYAVSEYGKRCQPALLGAADYTAAVNRLYTAGELILAVGSQRQSLAVTTVKCIVLAHAENAQFWGQRSVQPAKASGGTTWYLPPGQAFVLQSAEHAELCKMTRVEMAKGMAFSADEMLGGDTVASVRAMMQKPCLYASFQTTDNPSASLGAILPFQLPGPWKGAAPAYELPLRPMQNSTSSVCFWPGYYAALFSGFRSSTGIKAMVVDNSTALAVARPVSFGANVLTSRVTAPRWSYAGMTYSATTWSAIPTLCNAGAAAAEASLPFQSTEVAYWCPRFTQVSTTLPNNRFELINVAVCGVPTSGDNGANRTRIYGFYQSDMTAVSFRRTPMIYMFNANNQSGPQLREDPPAEESAEQQQPLDVEESKQEIV